MKRLIAIALLTVSTIATCQMKLSESKIAWIGQWRADGTRMSLADVDAMQAVSVDQYNIDLYPATTATYGIFERQQMSKMPITSCILTPVSELATKIPEPKITINRPNTQTPSVTIDYTWPDSVKTLIKNSIKNSKGPMYARVQLACEHGGAK